MKTLLGLATLVALAGCPPPPRYAVVDVIDPAPVQDAVVASDCGEPQGTALRTDENGRARVQIFGKRSAERCVLTIAKPGYFTAIAGAVQLCTNATACPPTVVQLVASAFLGGMR
jgi:hypothetical protein